MSERWTIGIDGSEESLVALEWARSQSTGRDVELDVVHADHASLVGRLRSGGSELAGDGTSAALPGPEHRVVSGPPGRALVDAARDGSLLIIGRRGAGGGWRNALGSVSRYCVSHSSVPTIVVPSAWRAGDSISRVVVGFDGSAHARAALRWARDFFADDIDLRALVAIEVAPWLSDDIVRERLGDEVRAEERRLRDLLQDADPEGRALPDVVTDDARPALARAAEAADVVVLGAHGAGGLGAMLLGSVAGWMLDGSPTPVAVVPAPHDPG